MVPMRCMQVLLGLARQVLWFSWQVATVAFVFYMCCYLQSQDTFRSCFWFGSVIFLHDLVIQAEQECTPMSSQGGGGAGRQAHYGEGMLVFLL